MSRQDVRLSDRFDLTKSPVFADRHPSAGAANAAAIGPRPRRRAEHRRLRDGLSRLAFGRCRYSDETRQGPVGRSACQLSRRPERRFGCHRLMGHPSRPELRGEGRYDGRLWPLYGKGPGVDRSGDVMRHANMAGTSPYGGVLMAMGDDHTGESSTVCHQSDWGAGGCLYARAVACGACRKSLISASTALPCRAMRGFGPD